MRIMGGDPTLMRASRLDPKFEQIYKTTEASRSIEVPCQNCGRMVLLAPSGQRVALGEPEPMSELDPAALAENRVAFIGPSRINEGSAAVVCMWCALGDSPEILASLDKALADAMQRLDEVERGEA